MRKEFKSKISLNIQPIVPAGDHGEGSSAFGTQLTNFAEGLQADKAIELKREGERAGAKAGIDPNFKPRDDESQVFNAAFNAAGETAYIAQLKIDSFAAMSQIERDNAQDPIKYQAASDAYIASTVGAIDPRLKTQAEQMLRSRQAASGVRVADMRFSIIKQQQHIAVSAAITMDETEHFDRVRETGVVDQGAKTAISEQVVSALASGIYGSADSAAFTKQHQYREHLSLAYYEMEKITSTEDSSGSKSNQFLQDVAAGETNLTEGLSTQQRINLVSAMRTMRDSLNYAKDTEANEAAIWQTKAQVLRKAQISLSTEQAKPMLIQSIADGNLATVLNFQKEHGASIDIDIASGALTGSQGLSEKEALQSFLNTQLALHQDVTLAREYIDANITLNRPIPFTKDGIGATETVASDNLNRGEWELYKRTDDGAYDEEAMLKMQLYIASTGHLSQEFTGRIKTTQLMGPELAYWAQFYAPILSNEYTGDTILAQLPNETRGLIVTIAQMHRDGQATPEKLELMLKDRMGRTLENHQIEVLASYGRVVGPGDTVDSAWRDLASETGIIDDFVQAGKPTWFENVTNKNIRYTRGTFGIIGAAVNSIKHLIQAGDDMEWFDPKIPPEFQETILNYFTQSSMMYDTDKKSQENAMADAMTSALQNTNWGVTTFGGKLAFVKAPVSKWEHNDFVVLPEGWDHAKELMVEMAVYDAIVEAGLIDSAMIADNDGNAGNVVNTWDGESINYQEMLEDGRVNLVVIGDPVVGVIPSYHIVIQKKTGQQKILQVRERSEDGTTGPDSQLIPLVFTYPQSGGDGQSEIGSEYRTLAIEAAAEAKAFVSRIMGPNDFVEEMVFNEYFYEKIRVNREGMAPKRRYTGLSGILKKDSDTMIMNAKHLAGSSLPANDAINEGSENIPLAIDDNAISVEMPKSSNDVVPGQVNFDPNSSEVSEAQIPSIEAAAADLKANPEQKIRIEAFSFSGDSLSDNRKQSLSRAMAIRQRLVKMGIDPSRIEINSRGKQARPGKGINEEKRRNKMRSQTFSNGVDLIMVNE
jgi:outer membrane protein OmpA-like peptidoglycan-associated protein